MMKMAFVFKKVLKTFIWIVIALVLLFLVVAGLIQIPSIQTRVVHSVTKYIGNKTHTKVEIKNVSISFPKSVVVEGIYLEDTKEDTLLYAGKAKINIALLDLFSNKISINSFALDDANINLYSTKTDPNFNYNFLITAFSDTTNQLKADTLTVSNWSFRLNNVSLKNIRFRYNDEYGGINLTAKILNLELKMDEIDLGKSVYQINDVLAEGLKASVVRTETIAPTSTGSTLPTITAKNLEINNSSISYTDSISKLAIFSVINQAKLETASIDLPKQLLTSETIYLAKSEITYNNFATPDLTTSIPTSTTENGWKVSIKNMDLDDNSIAYNSGNKPELKNLFDADHLKYNHFTLEANNLDYSADQTKIAIKKFSATDQNNFAITRFETDFRMDEHSISAKKLKANTNKSSVDADFEIQFASLATLTDSMQFSQLNLDLKNASITNSDLLYFNPELSKQPIFKNSATVTTASGKIDGQMNNMTGKNVKLKTGANTSLASDFKIIGLPDYKNASYDFPNLGISTVRKDIEMLADTLLPESIAVPENISMLIAFKGKMKSFETTANVTCSFGNANLIASLDPEENFSGKVSMSSFNVGSLLKDTVLYGPVSLTAEANGKGLDMNTIKAKIKADVTEIYLNKYTYHKLKMDGTINGKQFEGKINLDDENAVFDFDGLVNLNPNQEEYKFKLNVLGADLQKLKLTESDIQISLVTAADLKGGSVDQMNGTAGITNIVVARDGKKYILDSFLTASVNEPNKSEIKVNSALIDIKYAGTVSPVSLPALLNQFINSYFPVSDSNQPVKKGDKSNFNFEIQFHNHPILSKVLLPELKEFEPGIISGSFDSEKNDLKMSVIMKKIVYGTTEIKDFAVDVNSDKTALNYKITSSAISNSQIDLDNFSLDGKLANNTLFANISSTDGKKKELLIRSQITKNNGSYKLTLDPKEFYLVNDKWNIAADNSIEFGNQGLRIHNFFINHNESQINVASVHDRFNDDLNIAINKFKLDDLSRIVEKDTAIIKGIVDGNVLLKRVGESYGLISDVKISDLKVKEIPIGNLTVKAGRSDASKFDIDVNLSGSENNLTATGSFIPNGPININTMIQSLSMKTVEAFSMGQITETAGTLTGNFLIAGRTDAPELTGELVFKDTFLKPSFLNNRLEIKNETVQLKKDGIYFNTFTMLDSDQHTAIIDGSVLMKQFSNFIFDLNVNTKDFLLFNTTSKNNKEFFGRMVVDSKIDVNGPMSLPVVNARVTMKKGSNFTFSVPEDKLTTDKGEDVVEFVNKTKFHPIMTRGDEKRGRTTGTGGYDLSSIIEIDKEATLRLLMDPASTDSLVVRGEAALSFTMDQSGKMSLTGAYNLSEGSYLVSLESVIKKKFAIKAGSTIIWNGDPMDADISIDAIYTVRASPYDLMFGQIEALSDVEKGGYKQRYPFLILLKLRGEILQPEISFEIQLSPENKGILGGAVNQKLNMLNEDESALNKQVFALLVLNRFIQENPFQTESALGTSTLIRSTVGKFLSAQLNQLSSKVIPGMELNFDIQSYDDYQTGQAKGRTQVEIGVKKQLFNERLSVELGGTVDVEGDRAKQNSASNITSDVTVEYKLTQDGRFLMKGFRHNQYEGAIEGQLVETGIGVVFVRDFNRWSRLFKKHPKSPEEKAP